MNVTVKDIELLKAIHPQQVATYLQAKGWQQKQQIPDQAIIWLKDKESHGQLNLVLPLNPDVPDFPVSMNLLLETLAKAEERSQLDILNDLIIKLSNRIIQGVVMQINLPNPDKLSGEITLIGVIFDKFCKIKAELFEHDYIKAIKAYQERLPVSCIGDLIKEGNVFILKNPRQFTIDEAWKN
ncbi:hypothetical protein [Coleofasciculus sp. F4-SAH-05]|uniref:hypothetical protein n=1 Tax=Coleofasciculus sp. F4-SAH-05 TaxID=3069525 RepID=UPI0032F5166D